MRRFNQRAEIPDTKCSFYCLNSFIILVNLSVLIGCIVKWSNSDDIFGEDTNIYLKIAQEILLFLILGIITLPLGIFMI